MEVEQLKNMGKKIISAVTPNAFITPEPADGAALLESLRSAAEACRTAYGDKKALATDQEPCVYALLNQWLKVFMHGLKAPSATYQPLHNIIAAGLNFAFNLKLLDTCLWNYTKLHLTKHEEQRFTLLKTVNTPIGYFKAFLRSSLNEKSLKRYLQSWIGHNLRTEYYEDWALVRDPNHAKCLPDIAAGLSCIFFALLIDKPELNESTHNSTAVATPEPIIDDLPVVKSAAKKNQQQIISFDCEDTFNAKESHAKSESEKDPSPNAYQCDTASSSFDIKSNLSTESPKGTLSRLSEKSREISSEKSGRIGSDSGSHQDSDLSSNSGEFKKPTEGNRNDEVPIEERLSCLELCFPHDEAMLENSDEYSRSDMLMKQYEQNNLLQLKMSQMEDEFRERSTRMEQVIYNLTRENNKLKDQLRNYVSAVETLKPEDDRSDECRHYEEKLVQVAQMHAELMEFNQVLQRQLQTQIDPFGAHYPLSSLTGITHCRVDVWIPSTYLVAKASKSFHVYQVFLRVGSDEWNVYRRYSEFRKLYEDLKNTHPDMVAFKFPPKKAIGKKEAGLVEQRRNQLQLWLRHVIQVLPQLRQSTSRRELTTLLPFFNDSGNNHGNIEVLQHVSSP